MGLQLYFITTLWDDNLVPRAINDYSVPEVLSFNNIEKHLNATEDVNRIFAIRFATCS